MSTQLKNIYIQQIYLNNMFSNFFILEEEEEESEEETEDKTPRRLVMFCLEKVDLFDC